VLARRVEYRTRPVGNSIADAALGSPSGRVSGRAAAQSRRMRA